MSKYTKGQWTVCGNNPDYVIDASNEFVCQVLGRDQDEIDEKKRLISAAQDAYELLKEMEWVKEDWAPCPRCLQCGADEDEGHYDWCKLAAYFRKVGGNE